MISVCEIQDSSIMGEQEYEFEGEVHIDDGHQHMDMKTSLPTIGKNDDIPLVAVEDIEAKKATFEIACAIVQVARGEKEEGNIQ